MHKDKNLKILGISHPYSWNNAACLIVDGKIVAFAEEERFSRIKYSPSTAAKKAMEYCLSVGNIKFEDLDHIAIGFDSIPGAVWGNLFHQSVGFAYYKIK